MEINITSLLEEDLYQFSHSVAEGGQNAGKNTWNAALNGPRPLLSTPEEISEFRDYVREFGAWTDEEIDAWDENECQALFLQMIAGDCREGGADSLGAMDWQKYQEDSESGRISGRMFRGDDGQVYFYIGN